MTFLSMGRGAEKLQWLRYSKAEEEGSSRCSSWSEGGLHSRQQRHVCDRGTFREPHMALLTVSGQCQGMGGE